MRRLLYVPILHEEADLGSFGRPLARASAVLSGEGRWAAHKETVNRFWDSVGSYLRSLDSGKLRVYQDGLAADGETGRRIVEEAARLGSRNYQLVLELLRGGAHLRKTEDPRLLLQERENVARAMRGDLGSQAGQEAEQYRRERERLAEERDRFIAGTINTTLKEGEVGVLFIGAFHNLLPHLAADISVVLLKSPEKLRAYVGELLLERDERRLGELARYLASPVRPFQKEA